MRLAQVIFITLFLIGCCFLGGFSGLSSGEDSPGAHELTLLGSGVCIGVTGTLGLLWHWRPVRRRRGVRGLNYQQARAKAERLNLQERARPKWSDGAPPPIV